MPPQLHPNSWTWTIENFRKSTRLQDFRDSFSIVCGRNRFYFCFDCRGIRDSCNQALVYLFREQPHESDVSVLWSVALMNDVGEVCHLTEIPTSFKANSKYDHQPVTGGFYNIKCNFILDPVNGLPCENENLTIKCSITSLDDTKLEENTGQRFRVLDLETLKDYQSLLSSSKFSDVVLVAGGVQFKLHKAILAARSPVFEAMFDDLDEKGKNQIEIPFDVDAKVFAQMLKYVYGENVASIEEYAEDLLTLSDKFELEALKLACARSLAQKLNIESVTKVFALADDHKADELKLKCIDFINLNSEKVMATNGWVEMATTRVQLLMELYRDVVTKLKNI